MKKFMAFGVLVLVCELLVAGEMDQKQMAGNWKVVVQEKDAKKAPDELIAKIKTSIGTDGKLMIQEEGKPLVQALLKLDAAKKPKQVDLTFSEGGDKGKTLLGIYDLAGDDLKLCYSLGKDRPADFATKPGNNHILYVFKREVPPKLFTNSVGMTFVWIAPGSAVIGSNEKEEGRNKDETPHKVTFTKGVFMGLQPVTQEQWQAVMGNNPSHFKGEKNLPVEQVSWLDCQEFIKKLSDKDKKPYRLPTESEWERACRAGTAGPFSFGENISSDQANYNGDEIYAKGKKGVLRNLTTPVTAFPPNPLGIFDMHGNVWEWCSDWYGDYPKDAADPQGPEKGQVRVVRGGAPYSLPASCRSAARQAYLPNYSSSYIGCRICYTE